MAQRLPAVFTWAARRGAAEPLPPPLRAWHGAGLSSVRRDALLLTAPSTLEFTNFPDPAPAADEVLFRIRACGICGSDLHGWDGLTGRRRPPLIMGLVAAGEIVALGAEVSGWRVGECGTFDSTRYCGECASCREGRVHLSENRRVFVVRASRAQPA